MILTLIILPLVVTLLFHLPPVQNYVVRKATEAISRKLETKVSIDRIHMRFFSRLTVDGFYVEDYRKDTLLYVNRVDVNVVRLGLFRGHLALGDVEVSGVRFFLEQTPGGISNLKQILLKLKRDRKEEPSADFRLTASSVRVRDMAFRYRKNEYIPKEYGVNFTDIDVPALNVSTEHLSVVGDSISMRIRDISLREKSGFAVSALSSRAFSVSGSGLRFDKLHILMPDSELYMDYFRMLYSRWKMNDFLRAVRLEARITRSKVSFQSIAYFAPRQRSWFTCFQELEATVNGPVSDLSGDILHARVGGTQVALQYAMTGIPRIDDTRFDFRIRSLSTHADDIQAIVADIAHRSLGKPLTDKLRNLGDIGLTGHFDGSLRRFTANAALKTSEGGADMNLQFTPAGGAQTAFAGSVSMDGFNLGKLLGEAELGRLSAAAKVKGAFVGNDLTADTDARLSRVEYNGYPYGDITMKGRFSNRQFRGGIVSGDPNFSFGFDGMIDMNDSIPHYDFDMQLRRADLHRLNFNRRDSVSILRCNVTARGSGSTLDNMNGMITISDLLYVNQLDSVRTGQIRLLGENNARSKYLAMKSSFADAEFRSRMSYSRLSAYFENVLRGYLPTLSARMRDDSSAQDEPVADPGNYSLLKVDVKQANNVAGIFVPGMVVASGSRFSFLFNPNMEKFALSLSSDYIEHDNFFVSKLELNSRNQSDSISLFVRADDVYASGFYMPDFSVIGGARDNLLNLSARFRDRKSGAGALVGVTATLGRNAAGLPQVGLQLSPSYFTDGRQTWNIYTRGITMDSLRTQVRDFTILSAGQRLRVDGVSSRSRADTLHISFSNFDLTPLTQFLSRRGYHVSGVTNGDADLVSARGDGMLNARILFDSVQVNGVAVPPALFESSWDFARERARFALFDRQSQDTAVLGYYRPTDGRYLVNADFRGLDLSLLDPLLGGVVSGTQGSCRAVLQMTGARGHLSVNGTIRIPRLSTKVDFLNVPYTLSDGELLFRNNILSLRPARLRDPEGNGADMEMDVNLNHLSNITYHLRIRPDRLLVMNTTERQNDLFYGRIYASGVALIRGDRRGVNLDITTSTAGDSHFYMPLSTSSDISEADFITFRRARAAAAGDSIDYAARKQMIFERRHRRRAAGGKADLNINMALNVQPNTDIQLMGDALRARGNGSLNLHVNPGNGEFSMYGDYQITEGSYLFSLQNIISKKFIIEPGSSIRWTGDPMDARLDIGAVYKLKASLAPLALASGGNSGYNRSVPVDCWINLTDKLLHPAVTFNVAVPNAEPETQSLVANALNTQEMMATQFFWLLAANSFYSDANSGTNSNIGGVASSATAFEFLSNQLSNWISSDKFDFGIRYRPKSDLTSDEVNVDFSTQLFSNRLLLDMEGSYDSGNNPAMNSKSANNFTGDFYLTWLIDRAGSLKTKAFSRTIDRFDENQGLQENGVGIYYKEDFNTFKDIVRNLKERFSGKRRKKRQKTGQQDAGAAVPGQTETGKADEKTK